MIPHTSSVTVEGLYDPRFEHDSCGVGFLARLDGVARHEIVQLALQTLINLEHRGAVGGDTSTGDGAGLMLQIPDELFRSEITEFDLPEAGRYAVGMTFLPKDPAAADRCRRIVEEVVEEEGAQLLGWRSVPTQDGHLGDLAKSSQPVVQQFFLAAGRVALRQFERKLYVIRRVIEKRIAGLSADQAHDFYICSLSNRTIVYKGLLTGTQVAPYFPELTLEHCTSSFAVVHQRYSTNTIPTWTLAQPFRYVAHNGEINTLRGNISRMHARESLLASPCWGDDLEKIRPVLVETGSDSAIFDNALELLVLSGRSLSHAMMMMIPEACGPKIQMSEDKRAFYEYHAALMEPWDGPAAMIFCDGRYIGGTLDRNGLRPARYTITREGMIVLASETGVIEFPDPCILRRGRLQPGKMFLVDLEQHRVVPDNEIKAKISRQKPYRRWVKDNRIELRGLFTPAAVPFEEPAALLAKQHAFGYTDEELRMVISPMASRGQEAVGSMGNDAALAVLSNRPQLLFAYFKQLFAQVTNPPIDPLREELVMSLESFVGRQINALEEQPKNNFGLKLPHPIMTMDDMERLAAARHEDIQAGLIDILFPSHGNGGDLEKALQQVLQQACKYIEGGCNLLILTDRKIHAEQAAIPSLLAVSGLHHHLIAQGLRNRAGIIIESGEPREVIHFSLLLAFGADAICPYLAFETVRDLAEADLLEKPLKPEEAMDAYITAIKKGLLKTFSRMGISTLHSFFGSQIFEAVGLSRALVDRYFCGTPSRIGGLGLEELAKETLQRHSRGFSEQVMPQPLLEPGGDYHMRHGGEKHLWNSTAIYKLQQAAWNDDYAAFKEYSALINAQSRERVTLRSLLKFKQAHSVPLEEVEPEEALVKRFVSSAMSFGSISREAHETIAIAMNRLGGHSNSGEGGEDPTRNTPMANGDSKRSSIRQIASGRFGVTTEYAVTADELQIKIAQGAKPCEGGQLPGHKVSAEIAMVRHTTPGVTLISPPPHHDIYSIEDLAQLIYDLKAVNPRARVSVKLVSEVGVGTVAAGVAKAKADMVLIAGHDGGTGASPLTSIKHTGLPWELGLAETQQTLIRNRLRSRIRVQVDGQLKTGRDLAIAALLGAEEFGFGTTVLVVLGCVLMRKCHLNTCPVGVATQDPALRAHFKGKPEYVERFMRFMARELREYMAELGFRTLDEMVGHAERLEVAEDIDHWKASTLDLRPLLKTEPDQSVRCCVAVREADHADLLDHELIHRSQPALEHQQQVRIDLPIRNVHRTVGARLSGEIVRRYGSKGLPDSTIQLYFKGSAGQSLGAFLAPGVSMRVEGDANDFLGKSMSGGRIVLVPPIGATFQPHENIIVGNVVLYGATGGEVFINGVAGERFAVRNSGARAVVEGVGDHGCEYMTGGMVVVIGQTGNNFAAGMSGGIAYVYDESQLFDTRCNLDMVDLEPVWKRSDVQELRAILEDHYRLTNSPRAKMLLEDWDAHLPLFVKVMPIDYRQSLERMKLYEDQDKETVAATEEVFHG
ncbi:glutamate synthase large subunit [bacterium]|nr:glutamate synthase large subunit [bacterium]